MYRLFLINDEVNGFETVAYALQRIFSWSPELTTEYVAAAHAQGRVFLRADSDRDVIEEWAARMLTMGLLPRIEVFE